VVLRSPPNGGREKSAQAKPVEKRVDGLWESDARTVVLLWISPRRRVQVLAPEVRGPLKPAARRC